MFPRPSFNASVLLWVLHFYISWGSQLLQESLQMFLHHHGEFHFIRLFVLWDPYFHMKRNVALYYKFP